MIRRFRIWLAERLAEDYITEWHFRGVYLGRRMMRDDINSRLADCPDGFPV